ncbi:MAG: immune inhibitor A [Solirubrobacterales bacterium]|nr:immune inhibitor A [Solirubrobacterales bacterium]
MARLAAPFLVLALAVAALSGSADAGPAPVDATLRAAPVAPGEAARITGTTAADQLSIRLRTSDGERRGPYGPFPVAGGEVQATLPPEATKGLSRGVVALEAEPGGQTVGALPVVPDPGHPTLSNDFVSSKGWVKPGEKYPFTLRVANAGDVARDGGTVTVPRPAGTTFESASGGATVNPDGSVTWNVGEVPPKGEKRAIVEARAATLQQDPRIVWKDLSTTATGTATGGAVRSHGPKVIPPSEVYDSARYGDRPFPVVPVDFSDRKHEAAHTSTTLAKKINDPGTPGSTFNLYQEMSYGQLFPRGTVPSEGVATADWSYGPGFDFTKRQAKADTCAGVTTADLPGEAYKTGQRIQDGWYQLPGSTGYYGSDSNGSAIIGSVAGVGALQQIDSGCGPAAKAVYDAATISDPEIDYDDYDTDKDGVVDFFMMVFTGLGGNGDSQLNGTPPYDNIWPHSASLENSYTDANGEKGYVTDDQRRDHEGRLLWYTDASRTQTTTEDKGDALRAMVRVGPYNVNPESAIEKASVISHEYGHSLGLPDFYSTGNRETYGYGWTLMAEDHSQHIDVFGRQELGWLVPRVLEPGRERKVSAVDSTHDTHRIDWRQPDGTPYALSGDDVHNGEAYVAKLPPRRIIDAKKVPSGTHVWWSGAGNDFGCAPLKGHNLDLSIPALRDVAPGTKVTLSFKSAWDIEWDYDYAFVLTSADGGKTFQSHPSAKGYTTDKTQNPNANDCQGQYGNGLTGSSDSYANGTPPVDRVLGEYGTVPTFVDDEYDLSDLAGKAGTIRFSYATDPGLARSGWFVDDIVVKAGDKVLYSSDAENAADPAVFNGGCREDLRAAPTCTKGWTWASAVDGSPADHAYYLELRDRAGFDLNGKGEDDRDDPSSDTDGMQFEPGLSLVYTDENHGYGNMGTDDPPAQSPLDSKPDDFTADDATPNLKDAAWTADQGRNAFSDGGKGHVDNYSNPAEPDGRWRFAYGCLDFKVDKMDGRDLGPENAPGNLTADVTFKAGAGCAPFDYGYAGQGGAKPVDPGPVAPTAGAGNAKPRACAATTALRRATIRRSGRRGLRFDVAPRSARARYTVQILRGGRVVKRFTRRAKAFSWNGRGLRSGTYAVRVVSGRDVRKTLVTVGGGRLRIVGALNRVSSCGTLKLAAIRTATIRKRLEVGIVVRHKATVSVTVLRGKRVVKRAKSRPLSRARVVRFSAKGLKRGTYRVVVQAKRGDAVERMVLVARR